MQSPDTSGWALPKDAAPLQPEPDRSANEPHREIPFRFTGSASEYFRIWIVNLLLTILTLGIYSAWAKVRNKQYFYRHTFVEGSSFEYLANPMQILKGRLIVATALGLLVVTQMYSPVVYAVLIMLFLLLTPWVVVKALAFNAKNSAFRHVRFAFQGTVKESFRLYLAMALLYLMTCGLGYPYAQWRVTRFLVRQHNYGDLEFDWQSEYKGYYLAYGLALLLMLPALGIVASLAGTVALAGQADANTMLVFSIVAFYAYLIVPGAFLRARLANLLYGGMTVSDHGLRATQRGRDLLKLYLENAIAVVCSLGLLIPWAKVRLARYRANHLTLLAAGSLEALAVESQDLHALGDAATDLGDFDFDLGL